MDAYRCLAIFTALYAMSSAAQAATCTASDHASFSACIAGDTIIEVAADITLDAGQQLALQGVSAVTINGNGHTISETVARYQAIGEGNGHMLRIEQAANITVRNLAFASPARHVHCRNGGIGYGREGCMAAIAIIGSDSVVIGATRIDAAKTMLIGIAGSRSVHIANSDLMNAATFNIWIGGAQPNHRIAVTGNTITGAGANGVFVSHANLVLVGNNTLTGNHWDTQFFGYGGGQVLLETHSRGDLSEVTIAANRIRAGNSRNATGIELAAFQNSTLEFAEIIWNVIENHRLPAIIFVPREQSSAIRDIIIANNNLNENAQLPGQILLNSHVSADIGSNRAQYGSATTLANFNGTAKTCQLQGLPECTINIQWSSTAVDNPRLYVRRAAYGSPRQLVATSANGNFSATWINANGGVFELVSGNSMEPVASINVRGVP